MKLNKLLALLVALLLAALPALAEAVETAEEAPEATEAPKTYTVEAKTFPFYLQYSATMDPEQDEMKLYFVNGGDIPYVSLTEYMTFLSDILEDMDQGKVEFKVELISDNIYSVSRDDNKSAMLVSPEEDSLFFLNLNGLTQKVGSRAAVTIKDLPEGEPMDLETAAQMVMIFSSMVNGSIDMSAVAPDESTEDADAPADEDADAPAEETADEDAGADDDETADEDAGADDEDLQPEGPSMYTMGGMGYYLNRQGDTVEFKLGDYMIDVIDVDGECYLPFQTMNDIFLAKMYLQFIFTGERVLGCGYEAPLAETRYSENPGTFSEDFAIFNYNELRFLLDTFYGLKHEHNINDFGTLMALDTNLIQDLAGTDPRRFDLALMQLAAMYLDDGHSGYIGGSVLAGVPNAKLDSYANYITFGPSTINRLRNRNKFDKARRAVYRAWVPGYEEVGRHRLHHLR